MCRSKWKGFFIKKSLLKNKNNKNLRIWNRNVVIPSFLEGKLITIHNGRFFKNLFITREKVGFKFGSFIPTRNFSKNK
jgi:ribosomal protein S19